MSMMANLGIGFQEPLTCPGVKLDEKMTICYPLHKITGDYYKIPACWKMI